MLGRAPANPFPFYAATNGDDSCAAAGASSSHSTPVAGRTRAAGSSTSLPPCQKNNRGPVVDSETPRASAPRWATRNKKKPHAHRDSSHSERPTQTVSSGSAHAAVAATHHIQSPVQSIRALACRHARACCVQRARAPPRAHGPSLTHPSSPCPGAPPRQTYVENLVKHLCLSPTSGDKQHAATGIEDRQRQGDTAGRRLGGVCNERHRRIADV